MVTYPMDWEEKSIDQTVDRYDELRIPIASNLRKKGKTPYYGANGVLDYIDGYTHDGEFVLIAEDGANDLKRYPIHYVNGKVWVNNHAHVLKGKNGVVNTKFLSYALRKVDFESILVGGTRVKLNSKSLMNIIINIPKYSEQKEIAKTLSDFDTYINDLEKLIEKKKNIRDGALEDLICQRTRLVGYKDLWETKTLDDFVKIQRGASPRPIENYLTSSADGINWIKIGDAPQNSKYITSTKEKITISGANHSLRVYFGDFILSNSMSFGRPYIMHIDGCIHDGWLRLYDFQDYANSEFLYYLLSSSYVQNQYKAFAAGSGVQNLKKEIVKKVVVSLPSIQEQEEIASILNCLEKEISNLEEELFKIIQIRDGAMDDLLTGQIRLTD